MNTKPNRSSVLSHPITRLTLLSCCLHGAAQGQGILRIDETAFTAAAGLITFSEFAIGTENPTYLPSVYGGGAGSPTVTFGGFFTGQSPGSSNPAAAPPGAAISGVVLGLPTGTLSLDPSSPATFITQDGANPSSPVLSGTPQFNGAVSIHFGVNVVGVGLEGGFFNAIGGTAIRAFGRDGTEIGLVENLGLGIEFLGLVTADGSASIAGLQFSLVGDEPAGFAIDNLRFGVAGEVVVPGVPLNPFAGLTFLSANRQIETVTVQGGYQDLNSRLFRLRSGFRAAESTQAPAPISDAKGGSSKGGAVAITETVRPWEVFGSVGYQTSEFDRSTIGAGPFFLPGYDLDVAHGTAGVEYDFNSNFSVGGALIGSDGDAGFDDGSKIDVQRYGIGLYGSYYRENAISGLKVANSFYADLLYGYSQGDYDTFRRAGAALFSGSTESSTHLVDLNTGLNFHRGNLRHGPTLGLAWQNGEIDGYTEAGAGGLTYAETDVDSVVTSVGYQASYAVETAAGTIVPQLRAAWEHEFEDQGVQFAGATIGGTDDDTAVLGAGVLWQFHELAYSVLDYEARLAEDLDRHQVNLRVGLTF
jgi:uncharacterized protein YhjY with autotransporter beta-barrel domain